MIEHLEESDTEKKMSPSLTRFPLLRLLLPSHMDQRRRRLIAAYVAGFLSHAILSRLFFPLDVDCFGDSALALSTDNNPTPLPPPFVPNTRYEVLRYDSLDEKWLFNNIDSDPRIGLTRHHKADVADIARQAVKRLVERERLLAMEEEAKDARSKNKRKAKTEKRKRFTWKLKGYRRGWRRFDPTRGEEHKMLIDVTRVEGHSKAVSERRLLVSLVKPFASASLVGTKDLHDDVEDNVVHFIVPVARLSSRFDDFIANYEDVCLKELLSTRVDEIARPRCALMLVVFDGPSHLDKDTASNVEAHLARLTNLYGASALIAKTIRTKNAFTRALGMDLAARQLPADALIFFVDVDVSFDANFVENCVVLAERGKVAYYPIVFSQYDPQIVGNFSSPTSSSKTASKKPPPDMKVISKLTGHWVVYGFGMVCLYKSDYEAVGGYDLSIRGWGGEDVTLYDSHVRHASIAVTRACEPGLVHRYHERYCDPGLGEDQLRMCLGAAAESLGSRAQLANLVVAARKKDGKRGG